jgi:hypothetical protein
MKKTNQLGPLVKVKALKDQMAGCSGIRSLKLCTMIQVQRECIKVTMRSFKAGSTKIMVARKRSKKKMLGNMYLNRF